MQLLHSIQSGDSRKVAINIFHQTQKARYSDEMQMPLLKFITRHIVENTFLSTYTSSFWLICAKNACASLFLVIKKKNVLILQLKETSEMFHSQDISQKLLLLSFHSWYFISCLILFLVLSYFIRRKNFKHFYIPGMRKFTSYIFLFVVASKLNLRVAFRWKSLLDWIVLEWKFTRFRWHWS